MGKEIEVVFSYRSKYPIEIPSLIAYDKELITCINSLKGDKDEAKVLSSENGYDWNVKLKGIMNFWAYQYFNDKLYVGASTPRGEKTFILEYDGTEFRKVLELTPGGGGGGGLIESLGVFKDSVYAGRRNEIWKSSNGVNWEKVYSFSTNKSLYQFFEYDSKFYAFEGEPIKAPSRVYYTVNGENWSLCKSYSHVEWFRSHSPSNRVVLDYPYIADGRGSVYFFNGELHKILERRQVRQGHNVAIRLKTFENRLYILYGAGTSAPARGEVWVWDGYQLGRLIQLPYGVYDMEVYNGSIYLACNNWSGLGGFNESFILKIPVTLKLENPPLTYSLTSNGSLIENTPLEGEVVTDPLPALNYKILLYLRPENSLTLDIEVLKLNGEWEIVNTLSFPGRLTTRMELNYKCRLLRFRLKSREKNVIKFVEAYLTSN